MVIFQKPNTSSIVTAVSILFSFIAEGILQNLLVISGVLAGTIWSYQELKMGINMIRKFFGLLGFMGISIYLFLMLS